jgi:predicted glutamine amidotransferase
MCGVFGIHAPGRDVARLAYFALYALQHRGQESAGIAVSDGRRVLTVRDMGLVAQVFDEGKLQALPGRAAIGHARYSTTGSAHWMNSQPIVAHRPGRTVALGHNGNLTNTSELRAELQAQGVRLASTSDTEVICALIAHHAGTLAEGAVHAMERIRGAFRRSSERGHAACLPRSRRHPPARARRSRRLARGGLGDPGARHHRRDRRARAQAGRAPDLRLAASASSRRCRHGAARRCACSSTSTSRARTPRWTARRCMPSASAWASGWRPRRPRMLTS